MLLKIDKGETDQMSDEDLGQHFRYLMGESEHIDDNDEAADQSEEDASEVTLDFLYDDIDEETGIARRVTLKDIEDMDDTALGKLVRKLIAARVDRKTVDVSVFDDTTGDTEEGGSEAMAENKDGEADADGTYTLKDVAIFATGTYKKRKWGLDDLKSIVSNFKKFDGQITPPLKLGHDEQPKIDKAKSKIEQPAAGWVTGLKLKGSKLYADIANIPKTVYDAFVKKAYKRISSEIYLDFEDDKGNKHGPALAAVAALGSSPPQVKSLPEIDARYDELGAANDSEVYTFEMVQELILADDMAEDSADEEDSKMAEDKEKDAAEEQKEETEEVADETEEEEDKDKDQTGQEEDSEESADETAEEHAETKPDPRVEQILKQNEALRLRVQQLETDNKLEKTKARHSEERTFVDKLKEAGKLLPANEAKIFALLDSFADADIKAKFEETDKEGKTTETEKVAYDLFKEHLEDLPTVVDFSEHSTRNGEGDKGAAGAKEEKGQPKLRANENWVGEDYHTQVLKYMEEKPDEVKAYAEEHDMSTYEAAMDLME